MHSILNAGAHHTCIFICTMFLSEAKSVPIPTYGTAIIWEKLTAKQPDHNRWSEGKTSENDTQYVKTPPSSLKVGTQAHQKSFLHRDFRTTATAATDIYQKLNITAQDKRDDTWPEFYSTEANKIGVGETTLTRNS
jgi:hypothetical protein